MAGGALWRGAWRRPAALLSAQRRATGARALVEVQARVTPMVAQYLARKKEYPDCMLLFQVGDFYEFFGDDARRASHLLNLALTKKSKQATDFETMCGFPLGSLDSYVEKLVMHHGIKVAVCNQVESASSARQRGYKALVDRQVVRVVTPGSLVEDTMLTPEENNYLASVFPGADNTWGLAWTDLSTGEFVSTTATSDKLASAILRCSPKEILLPATLSPRASDSGEDDEVVTLIEAALPASCARTFRPKESFDRRGYAPQPRVSVPASSVMELDPAEHAAVAAILDYVKFTQRSATPLINAPLHVESSDHMIIDTSAWRSLELAKSLGGTKVSSLLQAIDDTVTPGGSRLLASHLSSPLMNLHLLERRLEAVEYFVENEQLLRKVRKQLSDVFDMERSLQRLSVGVATPKDLKNVAATITEAGRLSKLIDSHHIGLQKRSPMPIPLPALVQKWCSCGLSNDSENIRGVAADIHAALKEDYTALNSRTGFVRPGYSAELDKWRHILAVDSQSTERAALQMKYRELLGSTRLRVVYQAEKGFFIEIPHEEYAKLLKRDHNDPLKRELEQLTMIQSLKNSARFRSQELRDLNRDLMEAGIEVTRIELEIFEELTKRVLDELAPLQQTALAVSQLDVVCSHAQLALDCNLTRPVLDASRELHIEDARHMVVEAAHMKGVNSSSIGGGRMRAFVPNSLHCGSGGSEASCWVLTGPNMGGKSTFLRQNAHLVILAQMGSFVPARFARIGLVDKLFCRVGSADDLASDRSTFMVEMQETATILKQATSRSLVLMDEVGRGTAVNDGVAIATAVLESLSARRVRTLFATHFTALHGLIASQYQSELQFHRMEVLERAQKSNSADGLSGKHLVFSHRVVPGLADQSYGINTAALAGCPPDVVRRAAEVLQQISGVNLAATGTLTSSELKAVEQLLAISKTLEVDPDVVLETCSDPVYSQHLVRRIQRLLLEVEKPNANEEMH